MVTQQFLIGALLIIFGLLPLTNEHVVLMFDRMLSNLLYAEAKSSRPGCTIFRLIGVLSVVMGIILFVESISLGGFAR